MIRYYSYIAFLLLSQISTSQTALFNSGNVYIGEEAKIGFHTNFINNSEFNAKGFTGFYGNELLTISGNTSPLFFNTEISISNNDLILNIPITITNNANFDQGNIITPRNPQENILVNFSPNIIITGVNDASKVDGYVMVNNAPFFEFPIGDAQNYRQLDVMPLNNENTQTKAAYFSANPNTASELPAFDTNFITIKKPRIIEFISNREFWHLVSDKESLVTLHWNSNSGIANATDVLDNIIMVGWSKTSKRWIEIEETTIKGSPSEGSITSSFIPNEYDIITLGTTKTPIDILEFGNYLVTPNGDGKNDEFVIEELKLFPNNQLQIFNRYGLKVFEKENYTNEFNGFSNTGSFVLKSNNGLPSGIYFYVVNLKDVAIQRQGFLYLTK